MKSSGYLLFLYIVISINCAEKPAPFRPATQSGTNNETSTMTDQDGNVYRTVKIGNQWWMAENLKVTHYRNGEAIPNVTDAAAWSNLSSGAYCDYDNNTSNVSTYGRLYNWYAVSDSRNIAPSGWHVPTNAEWKKLEMYLGMSQSDADAENWRGDNVAGKLKETGYSHWASPNTDANNESGFTALPAGVRNPSGEFYWIRLANYLWTSDTPQPWIRGLNYDRPGMARGSVTAEHIVDGYSIRCIKD
jgi:uncharacterized protein (TIGR02145 family)